MGSSMLNQSGVYSIIAHWRLYSMVADRVDTQRRL